MRVFLAGAGGIPFASAAWLGASGRELRPFRPHCSAWLPPAQPRRAESRITAAIPAVLGWLQKLLGPVGAVFAVAKAIYDAVKWLIDNARRIERLIKTVFQGFRELVSGASVGQIAERVETTLGGLLAPIFDALAKALGLGSLASSIRKGLEKVRDWIQGKIQSLLEFLFKPLKSLFAKQRKGGVQLTPAVHWTVERKDGTLEEHELWVETSGDNPRDVRIRFSSPREEDAKEFVAKHRKRGKADLQPAVDDAIKLIGGIEAAGRDLLPPLTKEKKLQADATKIGKLQPRLLKQADELADRIKELQQAEATPKLPRWATTDGLTNVNPNESDLGRHALKYRLDKNVSPSRNVFVVEYRLDGVKDVKVFVSNSLEHSEEVAIRVLHRDTKVLRSYTDRTPCTSISHQCFTKLLDDPRFAEMQELQWFKVWGVNEDSTRQAIADAMQAFNDEQ